MGVVAAPRTLGMELGYFSEYSTTKQYLQNLEILTYFLRKDLPKEYAKLKELRNMAKPIEKVEHSNKTIYVNDKQVLENFKTYLEKIKLYGKKVEKYIKKYGKGNYCLKQQEQMIADGINPDLYEDFIWKQCCEDVRKLSI